MVDDYKEIIMFYGEDCEWTQLTAAQVMPGAVKNCRQTAAAVILQHPVSVTNTETVFMSEEFVDHSHINTVTQWKTTL